MIISIWKGFCRVHPLSLQEEVSMGQWLVSAAVFTSRSHRHPTIPCILGKLRHGDYQEMPNTQLMFPLLVLCCSPNHMNLLGGVKPEGPPPTCSCSVLVGSFLLSLLFASSFSSSASSMVYSCISLATQDCAPCLALLRNKIALSVPLPPCVHPAVLGA